MNLDEVYPTTMPLQPYRDEHWRVVEQRSDYVRRMRAGPLPDWPAEVIAEWLHRHASNMEHYAFLGFQHFRFERARWPVSCIPGSAAFEHERFCADYQNVEERAALNRHDWLAHYMLSEGTWNTPILLLDSEDLPEALSKPGIRKPLHLLEGHRRLAYLQGLKRLGKARPEHDIWLVRVHA